MLQSDITRQQADQLLDIIRQKGTDTTHIHALLTLAEFNIFKNGKLKTDLDSAKLFIDQAKAMNSKIKSVTAYGYTALVESYLARESKHDDIAKVLNDKAIQILNDAKNYNHLGQAYYQRATYYNPFDDSGSSKVIELYEKGIAAYKQINNVERQGYGYKRLGEYSNTVQGTIDNLEKSLALYKSIHYSAVQEVYDLMAVAYMYDLNIQKALPYALLALKVAEQQKDTTMELCAINNHIGLLYGKKKDHKNAVIYFTQALKTAEYYKDVNTIYFLAFNIINSDIALNSPLPAKKLLDRILKKFPITNDNIDLSRLATSSFVKIYTSLNDVKTGKTYTELLQQIDETNNASLNNAKLINDYTIVSKFYLMAKSYQLAAAYLKKCEALVNKSGTTYDRSSLIALKFRLDTAQGNYKSAVLHLLKYNITQDSIFNETKAIEFQKQQVQYETEKKDQQIKILEQKGLLQQSKLQHANLIQAVTFGGVLVMLVVSALIFGYINKNGQQTRSSHTKMNCFSNYLLVRNGCLKKCITA
ncbi:hypothetical protein [Mucilaginibacter celer]|uniref:Tetratricopeptide repeat protein n=1 Tax=Mucilaginibacter celer TaxID=2305508 RepID=A0A494VPZ9_9SPHI|nr:hypothetical protein [Mucilaginibacter celer]AYL97586.1 hypothetical protein HYN43_020830 [Mucilaginibacter celer]